MSDTKDLSIIIPCRNEERYIGNCLETLIANDYPADTYEIIVVDGMSDDKTREVLEKFTNIFKSIKVLDNPEKVTPVALNRGIREARGKYILILSSHSKVDRTFIKANIAALAKYTSDCVGGLLVTLPANGSVLAKAIASALSSSFGVGNAHFRTGSKKVRYVDTVPFGCYRRELFGKIGYFDEDLIRNQDDEFNLRLIKNGGKILLVPDIVSYYYARPSLGKLWKMYFQYGYFKPLVARKVGGVLTLRQLIPSCFILGLLITSFLSFFAKPFLWVFSIILISYASTNLLFSGSIALASDMRAIFVLPMIFTALHFSYGSGYLKGLLDFTLLNKHKKNRIKDVPLTR